MGNSSAGLRAQLVTSSRRRDGEAAFSLLEILVVIAIMGIIASITYVAFFNALPGIRADSGMQLLEAQLRQVREVAIDQRSSISVTFQGTSELLTACAANCRTGAAAYQPTDYFLPYGMVYQLSMVAGLPNYTPDGYDNGQPVSFCSAALPCVIWFQSDGSVVNATTGAYQNGTIYIGKPNQPLMARAVTCLASTGKFKGWRWNGGAWH